MSNIIQDTENIVLNGLNINDILTLAGKISEQEDYGKFRFRASNRWINGAKSKTSIQGFFTGGEENTERSQALFVDADQPLFLAGSNTAPNPVEHFLHALTSCLTTTLIYHASVHGFVVEAIETNAEGDMNSKGFFGISETVTKGYKRIRVSISVKSEAGVEELTELAMHSPVYEMVSKAVPVELTLLTF